MENKIMLARLLFWCVILPVGIFGLVTAIKLLKKRFSGELLLEISYAKKSGQFSISTPGVYSVWQKGPLFKKTPVGQFKPQITNERGDPVRLAYSLLRPHKNSLSTGRTELFTFSAPAGNYRLDLAEGSSVSRLESAIFETVLSSVKPVDLSEYFIEVRASQPFYLTLLGIVLAALSGCCVIGSFVLGLEAREIF